MTTPVPNFPVPAFNDLMSEIAADFAALPNANIFLRMGVIPVLTKILAKLVAGEYIYLGNFPNRCLIPTLLEAPYLDVYCGGVGLKRDQATPSSGFVLFSGTNGIPFPQAAQMTDSTGTITLTSTAPGTWSGNTVTVPVTVTAISTATGVVAGGSAGNLAAGAPVTLSVGIAGILANGVVGSAGLSGGADAESTAHLQVRLQARLSNPPQGGANADFVAWAEEVTGVTRVWVYPSQNGPGTVVVQFMMDGRPNPVPLAADVTNVQSELDTLAPTVGTYTAMAAAAQNVAVTISNLTAASGYTLAQAQAAATAAIAALNYTTTPGGYGWDGQAENYLTGGTLFLEQISAAISNAAGVGTFDLAAPTADITAPYGSIVQLEAPTFS